MTDIEIAQAYEMENISSIAQKIGIPSTALELYGNYKAKVNPQEIPADKKGKLILVTAINPTPAGEGKTTTTVGLGDALSAIGKKTMIALREPSLGPVFGMKGGAAGGGYAQVVPMEDINLHFTGDFHAIGAANNLLAAMLDNHIHQGNSLRIDQRRILWKRCVDMNDRQLRNIVSGLGLKSDGFPRQDGYEITVASEVMAILCLAKDIADLKQRLGKIVVAYSVDGKEITAKDLKAEGAMTVLLKEAIKPNLVQTLEGTPTLVHGGPFANIAHGCNSVIATNLALHLADYVVTEAGFGGDLGAEKFLDIKCRKANLTPSAVVIVATIRALKHHGGAKKEDLSTEDITALQKGLPNLLQHVKNMQEIYHLPVVVAINMFPSDTEKEITYLQEICQKEGIRIHLSQVWAKGSKGAISLAEEVVSLCEKESDFQYCYEDSDSLTEKLHKIVTRVYHGAEVVLSPIAQKQIQELSQRGYSSYPICMAKTQYSFSDNPKLLGAPRDFAVTIRQVKLSAGAGFIVAYSGEILTMPGLPKIPAAENIDIDEQGRIIGLF